MTEKEFSDGFDVYMNSYSQSMGDPLLIGGLNFDEYEKSVFLTAALEQYVKHLYKGGYATSGFEETEELRRLLDSLVKQLNYSPSEARKEAEEGTKGFTPLVLRDSKIHTIFELPEGCWYIVYESAVNGDESSCYYEMSCEIVPIPHDIYNRTIKNPFRGPNNRKVLRLDRGDNQVELVSSFPIGKYIIRYIERPAPIILTDLDGTGLKINNELKKSTCLLNDLVHQEILELAVKSAYASRATSATSNKSGDSD